MSASSIRRHGNSGFRFSPWPGDVPRKPRSGIRSTTPWASEVWSFPLTSFAEFFRGGLLCFGGLQHVFFGDRPWGPVLLPFADPLQVTGQLATMGTAGLGRLCGGEDRFQRGKPLSGPFPAPRGLFELSYHADRRPCCFFLGLGGASAVSPFSDDDEHLPLNLSPRRPTFRTILSWAKDLH